MKKHPRIFRNKKINFGRPSLIGSCVAVSAIQDRAKAGEGTNFLAKDYGVPASDIEAAIAYGIRQ
jgi:uncharacterized protein (DUF433 family)